MSLLFPRKTAPPPITKTAEASDAGSATPPRPTAATPGDLRTYQLEILFGVCHSFPPWRAATIFQYRSGSGISMMIWPRVVGHRMRAL